MIEKASELNLSYLHVNYNKQRNIIFLHGLFGNLKDFINIATHDRISSIANSYCIDIRNHGRSPHTSTNSISQLAYDLHSFMKQKNLHQIGNCILVGHSMGAMAVMRFTQLFPEMQNCVDRIVLMDINCFPDPNHVGLKNTKMLLEQLSKVNLAQDLQTLKEQLKLISPSHQIYTIVRSNIEEAAEKKRKWKCNLAVLIPQYIHLLEFELGHNSWRKPVQVVYGPESKHLTKEQIEKYCQKYPQMDKQKNFHEVDGAGHWVHLDNFYRFLSIMEQILQRN